jgi:methylmalonyl-CoA mutase
MSKSSLFDFPIISKEQWLAQITKDLKGKPFEGLQWQLEKNVVIDPFYTQEDRAVATTPMQTNSADWEISESVYVNNNYKEANKVALTALLGGANAIEFQLEENVTFLELTVLLKNIELQYISTHFLQCGTTEISRAKKLLQSLHSLAVERGYDTTTLRGSIQIVPQTDLNFKQLADLIRWAAEHLPLFKVASVNGSSFYGEPSERLTAILKHLHSFLANLLDNGLSINAIAQTISLSISIEKSYFLQIARLRTMRLLWYNLLAAYDTAPMELPITVVFNTTEVSDNENQQLIEAATMAMSAVLGGATRLTVLAAQFEDTAFAHRTARNVQHLLKMESYLDKVIDPAAGSYYIETLTEELAREAWEGFLK